MTFARSGRRTRMGVLALAATLGIAAFAAERWLPAADHRDSMTLTNDQEVDIADVYSFRSLHSGGANFAMADGSVRFVRDSIPLNNYRAAASVDGRETLPLD